MLVGDTEEKTFVPCLSNGMSSEQIYKPGLLLLYQLLRVVPLYTPIFEIRCRKDWLETLNLSFPDVQHFSTIFVIEVHTSFALTTLTEGFPCFFLSCKANARVKPAKTGHGPHSSWFLCSSMYFLCSMYFCVVLCIDCFMTFCVLFVCMCVLYYCHRVATQLQLTNISHCRDFQNIFLF